MKCPVHEPIEVTSTGFLLEPLPDTILRLDEEPVRKARFPNGVEAWLISGHGYFRTVLNDPRFTSRTKGVPPGVWMIDSGATNIPGDFVHTDGEEHQHYRRKLTREFLPRRISELRPRIQEIVDEHLDDVARRPAPVDLVPTFTLAVPSLVIAELLGVPHEHRTLFQSAAKAILDKNATAEDALRAYIQVAEILADVFDARASEPRDDTISRLIHDHADLTRAELTTICLALLVAGHVTTANLSDFAIVHLLRHPEQLAKFIEHPEKAPQVVDEVLRYSLALTGPSGPARQALEDVEIGGQVIRAGEWIVASAAAANVDPGLCPRPERFDVDRAQVPHATFGYGPHVCLGQSLARAEMEIMLVSLFSRFPRLRLAVPVKDLPFQSEAIFPGFSALPVAW